ncbi:MAG: murein L,D-transpeptidase catalytic domain family protein [Chitinophagaceae bacterium]|nr:murein L,D-transpeptidase catalytic domain family protein [Chitinophagaceae bacterium]
MPLHEVGSRSSADHLSVKKAVGFSSALAGDESLIAASTELYDKLQLQSLGLSLEAMQYAYKGYKYLLNKGALHKNLLTICDFSQKSSKKRMYIIDVKNGSVLMNTYVAHGRNSGMDYATKFSNSPQSLQSSLGFYVTKGIYMGKHGLSLKVAGMEKGFNDNAEARAIVVHGAEYIGSSRMHSAAFMGRSFGCPAVPAEVAEQVINTIENGSCLFIYHPSQSYLHGSKILNA